jgi:glyoxylase-like metal-dependent hydrolase (beta-lactamase superfamily II)
MKNWNRFVFVALMAALTTVVVYAQQQDFSATEIKTTKVADNFYTLEGQGGMIGVLAGPDGVFMVDAQYAQLTDKIVAAIKKVTPSPIRYMVNTHVHPDHTGGNENLGKMGVTIFSRTIAIPSCESQSWRQWRSGHAGACGRASHCDLRPEGHAPHER